MLHKLKIRFTIIIALLIICLLSAIFLTMYIIMLKTSEASSIETLRVAAAADGISKPDNNTVFFKDDSKIVADSDTDSSETTDITNAQNEPPDAAPDDRFGRLMKDKHNLSFLYETISIKYNTEKVIFEIVTSVNAETDITTLNESSLSKIISNERNIGTVSFDGVSYRYLKQPKSYGGILVLLNRVNEINTQRRMLNIFLILLLPVLLFSVVVGWLIATVTVKPIAQAWEKQKRFIADASHEMKTPLAVIAANLDVVESDQTQTIAQQSKWLGYIRSEAQRMKKLTEELLCLAKIDTAAEKSVPVRTNQKFSLSDLLTDACLPFESVIFEARREFSFDIAPDVEFSGHPDELRQVAVILLDNALKNSFEGTEISFTLEKQVRRHRRSEAVIRCSDIGTYIPPELRDKIFERFYRADKSRTSSTGGSGLGLSIAHDITVQSGGKIEVSSVDGGATVFMITLPL